MPAEPSPTFCGIPLFCDEPPELARDSEEYLRAVRHTVAHFARKRFWQAHHMADRGRMARMVAYRSTWRHG